MNNNLQIIEDYLPIWAISAEASREETCSQRALFPASSLSGEAAAGGVPGGGLWGLVLTMRQKNEILEK